MTDSNISKKAVMIVRLVIFAAATFTITLVVYALGGRGGRESAGFVQLTLNAERIRWNGVDFMICWEPASYSWFMGICPDSPVEARWRDESGAEHATVGPLIVNCVGDPKEIGSADDLVGKTLTSNDFSLKLPGTSKHSGMLLSVEKAQSTGDKSPSIHLKITGWDPSTQVVKGEIKGIVIAQYDSRSPQRVRIESGIFELPLWPVLLRVEALPLTRKDADRIKADYSPNHYVTVETIDRAAAAGDPTAEWQLGNMYQLGEGVRRDDNKALRLWQEAAEKGSIQAVLTLATAFSDPASRYFWSEVAASIRRRPIWVRQRDSAARMLSPQARDAIQSRVRQWMRNRKFREDAVVAAG